MRWQAGTLSGWGLLGLNLSEQWAAAPDIQPLMGLPLMLSDFPGTSPPRYVSMRPSMDASNEFLETLTAANTDLREHAVACGVPVILADNSGMRNLIDTDNCIALKSQGRVTGPPDVATEGWVESRVEEIVEPLETLYVDTQGRRRIGARGAEWILECRRTWRDHAASLKAHLRTLL
jgi:hypothetical protein